MTPAQLITLADQHQAVHHTGGQPHESGPGLMALAAMQ